MPAPRRSDPVCSLDHIRPTPAKAGLKQSDASDHSVVAVTRDALVKHYGSVKAMAFALGEVDPSLMNREFDAGKLARVDQFAGPEAKAAIALALTEAFGVLTTPQARIRAAIREMRAKCDEFEQFVELVR